MAFTNHSPTLVTRSVTSPIGVPAFSAKCSITASFLAPCQACLERHPDFTRGPRRISSSETASPSSRIASCKVL